ncbi:MAG: hypothetical protein KAU46_10565 [Candidatus Aminicenantes bacterium]|nr:hypothetical protein [Candidatus Aminicenantes bacterium]
MFLLGFCEFVGIPDATNNKVANNKKKNKRRIDMTDLLPRAPYLIRGLITLGQPNSSRGIRYFGGMKKKCFRYFEIGKCV